VHPRDCYNNNDDNNNKPIVSFGLSETGPSGGFGDRLRGMVTVYYLALMTNASFAVNWTRPYNLNDYFSVPSCDVSRSNVDHSSNAPSAAALQEAHLHKSAIVRNDVSNYTYFTKSLFLHDIGKIRVEVQTNSFHWKHVVRNPAFKERAASLGLLDLSQAELFKVAIDVLLGNPTEMVRDSFTSVLRRLAGGYEPNEDGPRYIGVQIRLGGKNSGAVAGWQDPLRHSIDDVQCFAKEAARLSRLMHIRSIFVTADSEQAVRVFEEAVIAVAKGAATEAQEMTTLAAATGSDPFSSLSAPPPNPFELLSSSSSHLPIVVVHVKGDIAHTDQSSVAKEHATRVWLKSVLDWWVLKHSSALVISRSGFGETAAASSSDAKTALRLKIASGVGRSTSNTTSSVIPSASSECEFEDILADDRDVFFKGLATG